MNIKTYSLNFAVEIATFGDVSSYVQGSLVREFNDFMRARGAEHNFLASGVQLTTQWENEDVQKA